MALATEPSVSDWSQPISSDNPVGIDLVEDGSSRYTAFRSARLNASRLKKRLDEQHGQSPDSIPAGDWTDSSRVLTEWENVCRLGEEILVKESKDLDIAAQVLEASSWVGGFAGYTETLKKLRGMCEAFWAEMYPRLDHAAPEERVRTLESLFGTDRDGLLVSPLRNAPLTEGKTSGPFCLWQQEQAVELSTKAEDERNRRLRDGWVTPDLIRTAVHETSPEFFRQQFQIVTDAQAETAGFSDYLDRTCVENGQSYAPSCSQVRETLDAAREALLAIAPTILAESAEAAAEGESADPSAPGAAPTASGGRLQTRAQAFKVLGDVAAFFETHDPHSLLAARIREVVRIGQLPPDDYYQEILADVGQFFRIHGFKKSE